uniref:glucuronosyltransferase n=1 Tax=Strongyloides venezuelensis TaxID=75913 RepID=A0A0K0FG91_STRVS
MFFKCFLLFFNLFSIIYSYKILVVNPKFGYSHVNFFSQVADILTEAGHNVTVLAIDFDPTIKHPGAYKANVITVPFTKDVEGDFDSMLDNRFLWTLSNSGAEQFRLMLKLINGMHRQSLRVFNDEELAQKLRKEEFDLGITETINIYVLGMFKVWGIKSYIAGYSMSLGNDLYKYFGLPFPSSFMPTLMSSSTDEMTYSERFENWFVHNFGETVMYFLKDKMTLQSEFDRKYGVGFYDSDNIIGDSSFLLLNSNPFLDIPGPKTPKMVEVSGIGIKDPKPLDEYWDKILSLRNKTVLVSFGSFAKAVYMPDDMKNGLLETMRKLKDITFIWKYEKPEDGTGKDIENLVISKWLPQSDLLNDDRLSLFVTHGGMGSTTELSFRGVPAIAIPIIGDQMRNSKLIERQKCGIIMNKFELADSNILIKNIKTILDDDTYRNNAKILSRRLNNRPIGSKRLLIEHVEFAAEFGRLDMLDLTSRNMGMIEYYNLDIIFPVFFGLLLFILVVSPKFGYSHVNFFSQVADILTEAGHDVTVLTINIDPTITHPGAYKAKIITFPATKEVEDDFANLIDKRLLWNLSNGGAQQFRLMLKFINGIHKQSLRVFNDEELAEKIRKEEFDLGITEAMNIYVLGMFKVWGIKSYVAGYSMSLDGTGKDIENLVLTKWMPQSDLLNDERISLFVTHGGMGSTTELSFKGVPVISIPIIGDQMRNS